jgi:phosphomannomutase/phosphoglucomutase
MDLKEKLQGSIRISRKKRVDVRLIWLLGVFGLALVVASAWLYFSESGSRSSASSISRQGEEVLEQILQPVQSLERILQDEQVASLAVRALENPETVDDLFAYVNGRLSQVSTVSVYHRDDVPSLLPADMGANGYAKLDMILSALEGKKSLMQIHNSLQPPLMFDAAPILAGEETIGVMLVGFDPEYVLSAFNPEGSSLGFIRLTQYNGRQPATVLREFGSPSASGAVPDRQVVPGTRFRIEFPQVRYISAVEGRTLLLMMLAGLLSMAAAYVLRRQNEQWKLEQLKEKALQKRAENAPLEVEQPPETDQPPGAEEAVAATEETLDADFSARVAEAEQFSAQKDEPAPVDPPPMHLHYDIKERRKQKEAEHQPVELLPEIFRAYDIRGVIDKTLDSGVARSIGQAVGSMALEKDAGPVVVARDGRLSGPYLMEGMIEGILSTGCDVLDIGAVPTGVLYYAAHEMAAGSGVMITGSHNPPDYNGFKIMIAGDTLHGAAITGIYERIKSGELASGEGEVKKRNVVPDYIERISGDIQVEKPLRVVIDCGNGIGGVCAAETLRAIGVEVLPMFDEVDGTFPNHHPDPSEPENLRDLIESVRLMDADLGLAFDGDADRIGVVTLSGSIIYPDRVMMLLAIDVLDRVPGATILYDVKCTGHLPKVIREAGGNPVMYKTGHSLMKAKMKEIGAPFAGEMSGHFFFAERWYGVDDGIYAAARLLEILGGTETPPEAILNALPTSFSTPELKVQMEEGENHAFIEAFKASARFEGAEIHTIDGLRADFEDGWGLVRASNTTPILVVRFDAETEEALERIKSEFRAQMLKVRDDLDLPF